MKDEKEIFSKNLNYYMAANNKVQNDLIIDLKIDKSTLSTWCTGKKTPRIESIKKLAKYFNISIYDLIEERSEYPESSSEERLAIFRSLSPDAQQQAIDYMNFLAMKEETNKQQTCQQ